MTPEEVEEQKQLIEDQRELFKNKMNDLRKDFQTKSKSFFSDATKDLFDRFPDLESFSWTQGEEYNDEEMQFYVSNCSESIEINGRRGEDYERRGTYEIQKEIDNLSKKISEDGLKKIEELKEEYQIVLDIEVTREKIAKHVSQILSLFKNDDYEMMFGDNSKITVNRNGTVTVEDYEYYH